MADIQYWKNRVEAEYDRMRKVLWHDRHDGLPLDHCEEQRKDGYVQALVWMLQEIDKPQPTKESE